MSLNCWLRPYQNKSTKHLWLGNFANKKYKSKKPKKKFVFAAKYVLHLMSICQEDISDYKAREPQ